jgi:hypothetical protein
MKKIISSQFINKITNIRNTHKPLKGLFCLSLLLSSPKTLFAASTPDHLFGDPFFLLSPIAQSLAGAAYTLKGAHDSILLNPASGAFASEYSIHGNFSSAARTLSASIFDSKSTALGAGFAYIRRSVEKDDASKIYTAGDTETNYQGLNLSLFGKLQENFGVGLTARYSIREKSSSTDLNAKSLNGDFGVAFKLLPQLTLGAVYKNILGDKNNLEPRTLAGGLNYELLPELTLTGALEKYSATSDSPIFGVPDDSKFSWAIGAQYTFKSNGLALRAGFREVAAWSTQIACAGIGYSRENIQIDYSLANILKGQKTSIHSFGLGMTF